MTKYGWALENLKQYGMSLNILDIGCGDGNGVREMRAAGHQVTGIDDNPQAIHDGGDLEGCYVMHWPIPKMVWATHWDVITMFDVIQHNQDGFDALREATVHSGVVLASVPYRQAPYFYHEDYFKGICTPPIRVHRIGQDLMLEWRRYWPHDDRR